MNFITRIAGLCSIGLLLAASCAPLAQVSAQSALPRSCGTLDNLEYIRQTDPAAYQSMMAAINAPTPTHAIGTRTVLTIPVVVHVVYKVAAGNISDAQVQSQIDALNRDYRKHNADTTSIPAAFRALAGDVQVEFCLAKRDPAGNPTNGITRTVTTVSSFSTNNNVKTTATGGENAWDASQYLNLWACDLGSTLLGYAQFPGGAPATDGVVIHYKYFGTVGTATAPYALGRTATHEVGHWLNLHHTWGDANCGDDLVSDTPTSQTSNYGCPTFPHVTCSNSPNGDMFMNYMDYVDDNCMQMFSRGQIARIASAITQYRSSLYNSLGCVPVNAPALDATMFGVLNPTGSLCLTSTVPTVVLKNTGLAAISSAHIQYYVDQNPAQAFTWTGSVSSFTSTNITLPAITYGSGAHTFTAIVDSVNGTADNNLANDTLSINFAQAVPTGRAVPFAQSFESIVVFPPSGYTIKNPDNGQTWQQATVGVAGSKSVVVKNFTYTSVNQNDDILLPIFNASSAAVQFRFKVAYAQRNASVTDTLSILASNDCGQTYSTVYKKWGTDLATTANVATEFKPTATAMWRQETVDLSAFTSTDLSLTIRNTTEHGNDLYLDDFLVTTVVGTTNTAEDFTFKAYPNPANDHLSIEYVSPKSSTLTLNLFDATGKQVFSKVLEASIGDNHYTIPTTDVPNGIYFLQLQNGTATTTDKITILR